MFIMATPEVPFLGAMVCSGAAKRRTVRTESAARCAAVGRPAAESAASMAARVESMIAALSASLSFCQSNGSFAGDVTLPVAS
jgi:hypothetical protein